MNWIIDFLAKIIGQKLDGYKTIIGGVIKMLVGVSGIIAGLTMCVRKVWQDQVQFPDADWKTIEGTFALGCYAIGQGWATIGMAHKVQKLIDATNAQTVALGNSVQAHTQAVMESAPCNDNPSGVSDPNAGRQ